MIRNRDPSKKTITLPKKRERLEQLVIGRLNNQQDIPHDARNNEKESRKGQNYRPLIGLRRAETSVSHGRRGSQRIDWFWRGGIAGTQQTSVGWKRFRGSGAKEKNSWGEREKLEDDGSR